MNEHEDVLRDALAGIKTKRTRRRITRFNPSDGLLLDIEEGKVYVPGKGIVQVHEVKEKILDCGHSAGMGLGHIADCGHAVCALCVERYVLECAKPGCFRKLCTVKRCVCCAREVDNVFYCRKHSAWAGINSFAGFFILNEEDKAGEMRAVTEEYYSRRLQLRARNEKKL